MKLDPTTKLAQIREAMANEDWNTAIKLAAKFQDLGEYRSAILRGRDALNNPGLYVEMGFDIQAIRLAAIKALKEKYSHSWASITKKNRSKVVAKKNNRAKPHKANG